MKDYNKKEAVSFGNSLFFVPEKPDQLVLVETRLIASLRPWSAFDCFALRQRLCLQMFAKAALPEQRSVSKGALLPAFLIFSGSCKGFQRLAEENGRLSENFSALHKLWPSC
jgi:hypothetical protein